MAGVAGDGPRALTRQQELFQLTERAPGCAPARAATPRCRRGRGRRASAELPAAVVEAVEGDVARRMQRRGRQDEGLQCRRLAGLRGPRGSPCCPADDVASKTSASRRISKGLSISPRGHAIGVREGRRPLQHLFQRKRRVERRQPQLRCAWPVPGQVGRRSSR